MEKEIEIYPLDSVIHSLNKWDWDITKLGILFKFKTCQKAEDNLFNL